jgi:hypothetical protein
MFAHLKTGEEHQDRTLLLTAILADAFNLGLEKMAEACPGTSLTRLSWLVAWHIRDGQRFRAGGHGEAGGYRNAKYGDDPGVLFYTHISAAS